jgi:hypothetical protein
MAMTACENECRAHTCTHTNASTIHVCLHTGMQIVTIDKYGIIDGEDQPTQIGLQTLDLKHLEDGHLEDGDVN